MTRECGARYLAIATSVAALLVLCHIPLANSATPRADDDDLIILGIPTVTLSLTSPPANNVYTAPASIPVTATAKVPAGTISRVDYYQGTSLVGSATTAPSYAFTWASVPAGTYTLTAKASSSLGFTRTSAPVSLRVCDVPTVSLTAPSAGGLFALNSNVSLQATAASPANACAITKVEFYAQGALVGTALGSPPYLATWTPSVSSGYSLTAKVYDERNVPATSAAVGATVEPAPTISITSPAGGTVYAAPATIPFTVSASDDVSVAKVEYYNGTTLIGTLTTAPYSFTWSNVPGNDYSVTAKAYDNQGLTTTSTAVLIIVTSPPTVSITAPASNAVIASGSNVTISANASDTDGSVTKVEFYQGTTLLCTVTVSPYNCTWSSVDIGAYSLTAKAYDNRGATTTSAAVALTVEQAPAVSVTSPLNNAPFTAPASIPIVATATDSDGVSKVEFYQGATLLGTVNTGGSGNTGSTYTFTWNSVAGGQYALTAKAYDSLGLAASSVAVNVTVTSPVPVPVPMALKTFAPASITTGGTSVLRITLNPKLLYVVNSTDANISVFDTTSGTVLSTFNLGASVSPYAAAVDPAGAKLYVTTLTNPSTYSMKTVSTASNTVTSTVTVGTIPVAVAVNPAGTKVYTANSSANTVSVVDTATNSVSATVTAGSSPMSLAVNSAGTRVYVVNFVSANVSVIDTSSNTVVATVSVGGAPKTIAVSPNGSRVYVPDSSGNTVSVIDTSTNTVLTTVIVGSKPYGVAINAAGTLAYVANNVGNTVSVIDTATNTVLTTVPVGAAPSGVALNPSQTKVYVANTSDNTLSVIDTATNAVTAVLATGRSPSIQSSSIVPPFSGATTGVGFTDTYPAGLVNTSSASPATSCSGTASATNGGNSVALSGGTIPYNDACTVTVNVTSSTAGTYVNNTGTITSSNAGNGASVSASLVATAPNVPPTVSMTLPANGATFTAPASITLKATASDADGTVSKVDFYYDIGQGPVYVGTVNSTDPGHSGTSWTYSNWVSVPAGTYSLTAKATDNAGATTTSTNTTSITVQVSTNNAPVITSVTPASTQVVVGGSANYKVVALDPDAGDTINVKLYRGATLLATGVTVGGVLNTYTIAYSPTSAVTNDQLTVTVTDNHSASAQSSVTLTATAPPTSVTPSADPVIPTSYATPPIGTIGASFAVSDSGAATYTIPIQVPPGTNGMQPNLALTYNSQGGNGLLGVAWSLTGLSVITRCPSTPAQDGTRVGINYDVDDTNDNYCLDGQRLVRVGGPFANVLDTNYSTSGTCANVVEYRTELESYSKILSYEETGTDCSGGSVFRALNSPYRFRVWTKSGQVFDYGSRWWVVTAGWEQGGGRNGSLQSRGNVAKVWVLDRVADAAGNFMEVDYADRDTSADGSYGSPNVLHLPSNCSVRPGFQAATPIPIGAYPNVEYWPTRIRYYASGAAQSECPGTYPSNQITFTYEDVPSQLATATRDRYYDVGFGQTSLSKRLIAIDTTVDGYWYVDPITHATAITPGTPAKSYQLWYRDAFGNDLPSQQTGRSLLQSVQECGADGVCLQPVTTFEWAQKDWNTTGKSFVGPALSGSTALPFAIDTGFNADGGVYVADWNGDGKSDLIGWRHELQTDGTYIHKLIVCLSTGSGFSCGANPIATVVDNLGQQAVVAEIMDINNDGRADLVYRGIGTSWTVCLSDGNTGCIPAGGSWTTSTANGPSWRGDMDGDGKIDVINYRGNGVFETCLTNGSATGFTCYTQDLSYPNYPYSACGTYPSDPPSGCESFSDPNVQYQVLIADVNGDGKADLVRRRSDSDSESQWKVCFSDFGPGRSNQYQCHDRFIQAAKGRVTQSTTFDFNGDGLADLASTEGQGGIGGSVPWRVCLSTGDGAFEFQDPNIHWDPSRNGGVGAYVDGNNNLIDYYNSTTSPRCRLWTGTGVSDNTKAIYGDFNGDGRTDVASWDPTQNPTQNNWIVCLSTGSNFSCSHWPGPVGLGSNPDLNQWVVTGDFNGDGKTDIVLLRPSLDGSGNGTGQLALSTGPQTGDVMTKITTGLGATTQISYAPLTDATVYTKGSGADALNYELDIQSPMYVVRQTQASDGNGGLFTSAYFYEGLRGRTDGRGLYGFVKKRMRDDSGIVTETEYQRVAAVNYPTYWPIVGRVQYVRKYAPTTPAPSPPAPGAQTYQVFLADISVSANDAPSYNVAGTCAWLNPTACTGTLVRVNKTTNGWSVRNSTTCGTSGFSACSGTPTVREALLAATTTQSWELDGTALPLTTTSTQNFDAYGNPLDMTVGSDDNYSKTTTNSYVASISYSQTTNTTRWLLGRLASASVVYVEPGDGSAASARTRSSAFTYSGIAGGGCTGAALGQLCSETIEPSDGSTLWQQTSYQYDAFGNRTVATVKFRQTDGSTTTRKTTTSFGYNGRFPTQITNSLNQSETRQFDVRFGVMTQLTGPNGIVTKTLYDGFGRKYGERVLDTSNNRMSEAYTTIDKIGLSGNEAYRVATLVSGGGTATAFTTQLFYDTLQREVRTVAKTYNNGTYATATTAYDNFGRKASVVKPAGGSTVTTAWLWDVLSRPATEKTTGTGLLLQSDYTYAAFLASAGIVIDGQPAAAGHKTTVAQSGTNITTRSTTKYVNSQGQSVRVTDGAGGNTDFRFDPFGNLIKTIGPTSIAETMTYDKRGRKKTLSNPDSGFWSYTYNGAGELVQQTDAKGQDTLMYYEALGRMVERREYPGSATQPGALPFVTVSSYDKYADGSTCSYGIGKLCETWTATIARGSTIGGNYTTPETRTQTAYDQGGRAFKSTTVVDSQTFVSITTFDANSRIDKLVYPSGYIVQQQYDDAWSGQLKQIVELPSGLVVHWKANSRYADGQINGMQVGNSGTLLTTKTYDGFGRVMGVQTVGNAGTIQNATYIFDALGNLKTRVDASAGQGSQTFSYDLLNRVTSDGVNSISYLADGRFNVKATSAYSYVNGTHQLSSGAGNSYGSYDADGNVGTITNGNVVRALTYTAFNLPSSITSKTNGVQTASVAYLHDGAHARIREVSSGATSSGTTYYLGGFEEHIRSDNVLEQRHYIRTPEGIVGIVTLRSNGVNDSRYWHKDHLGSVAVITDTGGTVKEKFGYDVWGNRTVIIDAQTTGDPYNEERGYTGHEQLVEVGLTHMNGRIYDPVTGTFLQADPRVQDPWNGQNYNRYAYVLNNPLSFTDPTGFSFWTKWRRPIEAIAITALAWWAAPFVGAYFGAAAEDAALVAGESEMTAANAFSSAAAFGKSATIVAGGFAAGGIQGGNIESAAAGAVAAGLNIGIGELTGHTPTFGLNESFATNVALHAALGCGQQAAAGGTCRGGALAGGFSAFAGPLIDGPMPAEFAAHILIGGIASRLGGDKFSNGAITAAFEYAFNAGSNGRKLTGPGHHIVTNQVANAYEWSDAALEVFDSLHGEGGGRIPVQGHNFGEGHPQYNKDLAQFVDGHLKETGIDPSKMTAEQAKDLIRKIDAEPKLRSFNIRVFMKEIFRGSRTPRLGGPEE